MLFHGSPIHNIQRFSLETEERYDSYEGRGLYCTENYKTARKYAGSEGCVYHLKLKSHDQFDATKEDDMLELIKKYYKEKRLDFILNESLSKILKSMTKGTYSLMIQDANLGVKLQDILDLEDDFLEFYKSELEYYDVLKYTDPQLETVILIKRMEIIVIEDEIEVTSEKEINYL